METERKHRETLLTCPMCGYTLSVVAVEGEGLPTGLKCPDCGLFLLQHLALTRREQEVAKEMCAGYSTSEIARRIGVSIKTIESHRQQIYKKLHIRDVASLTKFALSRGLTDMRMRHQGGAPVVYEDPKAAKTFVAVAFLRFDSDEQLSYICRRLDYNLGAQLIRWAVDRGVLTSKPPPEKED